MKSIFLTMVCISSISFASGSLTEVELKWKPTTDMSIFAKLNLEKLAENKIKIVDFKDNRPAPKSRVGVNLEKENAQLTVDTKTNVMEYVTDNFTSILKKAGLDIVKAGEDLTLSGDINDFSVTETNTYKGNLTLRLRLAKGEKVVWQGVVLGNNSRFGRSFKLDNYQESLSDTIIDAALNFVKNDELRSKLR